MFFDFEGRNFDTPTVESAISWREQLLVSLFAHLAVALLIVFVPRLSFIQEAAERRAERLAQIAELAEVEQQALLQQPQEDPTFVFVAPSVDTEADEPPAPDARPSDRDRVAQSPLRTLDPDDNLPIADGNSLEFVEADDPSDELDLRLDGDIDDVDSEDVVGEEDVEVEPDDLRLAELTPGDRDTDESAAEPTDEPGALPEDLQGAPRLADSSLTVPGLGPGDPDDPRDVSEIESDGLLGQVRETLRRSIDQQSFGNVSGDTGRYGPEIQFDTKGVEFGPWIRRFVAQIRRNWFIPYSVLSNHGHVVLTFHVHRNGSLTDLAVLQPSQIESFNRSASNALRLSNPTQPLPVEYPDDRVLFTVTFFFNEAPPGRY